jgi:hypothetical protein
VEEGGGDPDVVLEGLGLRDVQVRSIVGALLGNLVTLMSLSSRNLVTVVSRNLAMSRPPSVVCLAAKGYSFAAALERPCYSPSATFGVRASLSSSPKILQFSLTSN